MQRRINILYLIGQLHVGGAERQLLELAKRLERARFLPAICTFIAGGELCAEARHSAIPLFVLERRGHRDWRRVWQLRKLIAAQQIDLAHSFTFEANMYNLLANIPRSARACICSERTVGNWDRRGYEKYERLLLRFADHVIANSQSAYDLLLEQHKVAPGKLSFVHNGIAAAEYQHSGLRSCTDKLRTELRLCSQARIIGMVANLRQTVKNHRLLLSAARQIVYEFPEAVFVLVGEGQQEKTALQDFVRQSGLERHVVFAGARRDIAAALALFEIGVLCSDHEGLPNAVMEYMAAGLPVVASRAGGCAELVVDRQTGFLVPPGDAHALAERILFLLRHPEQSRHMGQQGFVRIREKFSIEQMVQKTVALYERVLWNQH